MRQIGKSKKQHKLQRREGVGGKGVIYSFFWDEAEEQGKKPVKVNDEVHLLCGHFTFVCYVWRVEGDQVFIAAHQSFQNKPPYQIRLVEIRTAYRCQHRAIDQCGVGVLLPNRQPLCTLAPTPTRDEADLDERYPAVRFNVDQRRALRMLVEHVDRDPQPRVLQGPPGTGKSTVLARAVVTLLESSPGSRILLCAPSNDAVDVIASKVLATDPKLTLTLIGARFSRPTRS